VSVLVDGSVAGAYAAGTNEGTVAGDLSRTFTLNETDLAGNVSNDTKLAPVPPLIGLSPEDAAAALEAAGFHAGDVTTGGEGPAGTVSGPANLVLAEEGATIDLTVADGTGGPTTKLVFSVVSTPKAKTTQRTLGARIRLTRAARVTAVLYTPKSFNRARGVKLYTWRFALRAGTSIVKLRLPTQVRHPGLYRLGWTATVGREAASRSRSIRVFRASLRSPAALKQRKLSGQVVVAGTRVQRSAALRFGKGGPKLLRATSIDAAFDLAARNNGSAAVMVVDVDELGVDVIRDLRIVFPSLKIVAVSTSPAKLAASKRAGANVTVRRAAAKQRLTKVVTRLLRSAR
jgi:hypothetical protein